MYNQKQRINVSSVAFYQTPLFFRAGSYMNLILKVEVYKLNEH